MRRLVPLGLVVVAFACGEAFSGDPGASTGGAAGAGAEGGAGGGPGGVGGAPTTSNGGAVTTTPTTGAGGTGGGQGGAAPTLVPQACKEWCDAYVAQGCVVPGDGDCTATCLARFGTAPPCDAEAAAMLACYASQWTLLCQVPDLCLDYIVEWADCLSDCAVPTCTGVAGDDPCGCTTTCSSFTAVAECSRYNIYCYCRLSGPLGLGPDAVTLQTTCWPSQEPVCEPAVPGCCGSIFF